MSKRKQSSKGLLSIAREAYEETNFWDRDPTPEGLISLYKEKVTSAKDSDDTRVEWDSVTIHADAASKALEQGNFNIACLEFFNLGKVSESLKHFSPEEIIFIQKLIEGRKNQLAGFRQKNRSNDLWKVIAQQIALKLWEFDTVQLIKIGKMTKMVFARMQRLTSALPESIQDEELQYFPNKPASLLTWLREEGIAPVYARLPGPQQKI